MVFSVFCALGVRWRKVKIINPEIKKLAASIARVNATPNISISIPATAAPEITPAFVINAFSAFPFCNPSSGKTAGISPEKAGQKIPHIKPKKPFVIRRTASGTSPFAK